MTGLVNAFDLETDVNEVIESELGCLLNSILRFLSTLRISTRSNVP